MGWLFGNENREIDRNETDPAIILEYSLLTDRIVYIDSELAKEDIHKLKRLTLEVNKRKVIDRAIEILDELSHREIITCGDHYIKPEEYQRAKITQYRLIKG
ncbi:hypothetical protein VPIG_00067 [Vibrio phage PWH3a-P1]|uniref:hypothetical protein n=1 Tax=Vibrio phage PWH3a-P1 TaxID=754058 RepID=UPI0002C0A3F6|nr:hypothetical protein VPIG_00067 [Vibrio phage PWH3a-P1]AGH31925.1 hypothetical protein VPIG_00067 [Vibrio phage PWH3a-P1]